MSDPTDLCYLRLLCFDTSGGPCGGWRKDGGRVQKTFLRDLYERAIGNIISSVVAILIALFVYVVVLPEMNKKQYESTLLMGAITAAEKISSEEKERNARYEVYLHLKEIPTRSSNSIVNRVYLLTAMYKYKYMGATPDFTSESTPEVVYFVSEDKPAAERLAYLVNLILPPGKGEPITAKLEPPIDPKDPEAGRPWQLGLWLPGSDQ